MEDHDVDQGITAFRQAVKLEPSNPLYRVNLAIALDRKAIELTGEAQAKVDDEVFREATLAKVLKPKLAMPYILTSGHWLERCDFGAAATDANAALTIEPNEVQGYIARGNAYKYAALSYLHEGNTDGYTLRLNSAKNDFSHAVHMAPRLGRGYYELSEILAMQQDKEKSIKYLQISIKLEPDLKAFIPEDIGCGLWPNNIVLDARFKSLL